MSQFKKDLIASFVFLIFGAFVLISVPLTIDDPGVSVMGPRVFPYFIGTCMVLLCCCSPMLRKSWLPARRRNKEVISCAVEPSSNSAREDTTREAASSLIWGRAPLYLAPVYGSWPTGRCGPRWSRRSPLF